MASGSSGAWYAGGSILSGLISSAAQLYANRQNILNQNRLYNSQVELANTAHQREVNDLRAAGLNPILSAMNGTGSASPTPQAANVQPVDGAASALSSYVQMMNQSKMAQAAETNAETNAWSIYDAKDMGRAGFDVMGFGVGGKSERVQTIRVNKVTGECYTLDGRRVKVIDSPDTNSGKSVPDGEVTVKYEYPDSSRKRKQSIGQNMTEDFHRAYDRRYRNPDVFRKGR